MVGGHTLSVRGHTSTSFSRANAMTLLLRRLALCASICGLVAGWAASASASGIVTSDPSLPPDGVYLTPDDVHATYSGNDLTIVLEAPQHRPFKEPRSQVERIDDGAGNEIEYFMSSLTGMGTVTIPSMGIHDMTVPFTAQGPVQTIVFGKIGNTTGTFPTEMLSMNLVGSSPLGTFFIRESPTNASTGVTTITDIGGGMFHIDSFFDVFTELSVDGGANWIPATGPTRVHLVPEPGTLSLLGIGSAALLLAAFRRRRRLVR
jgi:hypothetical protein